MVLYTYNTYANLFKRFNIHNSIQFVCFINVLPVLFYANQLNYTKGNEWMNQVPTTKILYIILKVIKLILKYN